MEKKNLFMGKDLKSVFGYVGIFKISKNYVMSRRAHCESSMTSHVFVPAKYVSVCHALEYIGATEAEKKAVLKRYG